METLQIEKANALKAFNEADAPGKKMLTALFGEKVLSQKITDRVKTFADACKVLGIRADSYDNAFSHFGEQTDGVMSFIKLQVIARALNEGWVPDWSNSSEYKYYPWFKYQSGVGLSFGDFVGDYTASSVGSRLCFKSRELAEYAGKQFETLYKSFLNF